MLKRILTALALCFLALPALSQGLVIGQPGQGLVIQNMPTNPGVIRADTMPGGDMGAQINAALALLPATGGTVDARGLTGNRAWSTAVSVPANVALLIGAVNVTQSATITLANNASLICQPTGFGIGNADGPSYFRQAAGANLQNQLLVSGSMSAVQNCVFDGNSQAWEGNNNPTSGPIVAVSGSHFLLDHLIAQNGASDGVMIYSGADQTSAHYAYGTNNGACCGTIRDSISVQNGGDGYNCGGTADVIFEGSQAENNLGNAGVELNNCPTWRFGNYDIGGNQIGIYIHGQPWQTGVAVSSNSNIVGVGQFGNQAKQDILIDSSSNGANYAQMNGLELFGTSNRASGTYYAVEIVENGTGGNLIAGVSNLSTASNQAIGAIYIHGATTGKDTIGPVIANGSYTGTVFNVPAGTALAAACVNGVCSNTGQTFYGAVLQKSASTTYGGTVESGGTSASDQYALAVVNPSANAYGTVEEDVFAGPVGSSVALGSRVCQRNNTGYGGTCSRYGYDSSNTKVMTAVEGGSTPTETGCAAGSLVGFNTNGQFSLTAACTASTITLTFFGAAQNGWNCQVIDTTTGALFPKVSSTTTSITVKGTGTSGDVLSYGPCTPY